MNEIESTLSAVAIDWILKLENMENDKNIKNIFERRSTKNKYSR